MLLTTGSVMERIAISKEDKDFIIKYYKTKSDRIIANFLCLNRTTVCKFRNQYGLSRLPITANTRNDRLEAEQELNAILDLPYMPNFHDSTMSRIKILNNIINGN